LEKLNFYLTFRKGSNYSKNQQFLLFNHNIAVELRSNPLERLRSSSAYQKRGADGV